MVPVEIQSTRLSLFRTTPEQIQLLVAGRSGFDFTLEPGWLEDLSDLEEAAGRCEESSWWRPFLIRLRDEDQVIGVCLHKGPPDENGMVEIAYAIAPTYRCQGYGRETVAALSLNSLRLPGVNIIRAHTQPDRNASSRVLAHCGFIHVTTLHDPHAGLLWRWELRNP
jgi:RimJ/RimL family protein N-acetyltransferase